MQQHAANAFVLSRDAQRRHDAIRARARHDRAFDRHHSDARLPKQRPKEPSGAMRVVAIRSMQARLRRLRLQRRRDLIFVGDGVEHAGGQRFGAAYEPFLVQPIEIRPTVETRAKLRFESFEQGLELLALTLAHRLARKRLRGGLVLRTREALHAHTQLVEQGLEVRRLHRKPQRDDRGLRWGQDGVGRARHPELLVGRSFGEKDRDFLPASWSFTRTSRRPRARPHPTMRGGSVKTTPSTRGSRATWRARSRSTWREVGKRAANVGMNRARRRARGSLSSTI